MGFHSVLTSAADFVPPTLPQSRLYARALAAMGREVIGFDLDTCGRVRMIVRRAGPLALGLIPGGVQWRQGASLTERRDALTDLPRLARRHGIGALITNCAAPVEALILRRAGHLPVLSGGYDARLDLTAPLAERRARMKGKWRNRLARAEAAGIAVRQERFSPDRHRWLLEAEAAQRRARRYRGLPPEFTLAAAQAAPEDVRVFTAERNGTRLGAMLFLLHDGAASYHIGHLGAEGRAFAAHNLILWQASGWLAARGAARIDLGPVETEREAGLARFKLGSGAAPVARGASCLFTPVTAPLGRWATAISR